MMEQKQSHTLKEKLAYGLFWSWNVIFLAFMVLGFAPRLLPQLVAEVRNGAIPANYLFYGVVLSVIPVIATLLGLTELRRAPGRLFALGYVVEGPLMLVLAIRFFLIRQATPALNFLLTVTFLGMMAFLWQALDPQIERRGRAIGLIRLAGLTLMLMVSLYAAIWMGFYAILLGGAASNWLGNVIRDVPGFFRDAGQVISDLLLSDLISIPLSALGFILLFYTLTLFGVAPFAIPILSLRAWRRSLQDLLRRSGRTVTAALLALTIGGTIGLFFLFNRQPQQRAFALLESPPANYQEAQALLAKRDALRAGLLNAYLAPFRYISAVGEVRHISDLYAEVLKFSAPAAKKVQRLYEDVAMPLLYKPVHPEVLTGQRDNVALQREPQEAAQLYVNFFDRPITEGEHDEIVRAVRSTWSAAEAEAAWQAVDDREVRLTQQEINVAEHGDWAEVELFEVYQNQTTENQEVLYHFNLPESAVITGLWLGDTPDRDKRIASQIAPRGAAQAVYRNEVRKNIDPALVEQIGPRQYRLRAFPVPPKSSLWNYDQNRIETTDARPFYLWLSYRTLAVDGGWPLPQLAISRNVYWDSDTLRLINGQSAKVNASEWLPAAIPASQPIVASAHRVDLPNGESVLVEPVDQANQPKLPSGLHLAVVLDRSFSMEELKQQVDQALADLGRMEAQVDVYLTSSPYRAEAPTRVSLSQLDAQGIVYFGGQNAAELLAQFAEISGSRSYQGVLVITDGSGYELGASPVEIPAIDAPVWLVHLNHDLPLGYDDTTLQAIQSSGGGVVGSLDEALQRLAFGLANGQTGLSDLLDGYQWSVLPTDQAAQQRPQASLHPAGDGFAALAARQVILAEMRRQRGALSNLETLDQLHTLAQQYGIVTPYSSMIVLITQQQQNLLDNLSQLDDRFEREVEAVAETTPATQARLTGVPEPEEWLLLGLAAAMLAWYTLRPRLALQRR